MRQSNGDSFSIHYLQSLKFLGVASLQNAEVEWVEGNQLQVGLLSQVAADASVIGLFWVDALNINRFPPG